MTIATASTDGSGLLPARPLAAQAHALRPFKTTVFSQGPGRWFEASSRKATPEVQTLLHLLAQHRRHRVRYFWPYLASAFHVHKVFSQCRLRWFDVSPRRATPKGHKPSSST